MRLKGEDEGTLCEQLTNKTIHKKHYCVCAERSSMFWKHLNAKTATDLLANEAPGTYLLRRSEHPKFEYTLSQKIASSGIVHVRIGRNADDRYNLDSDKNCAMNDFLGFTCVVNLIQSWSRAYSDLGLKGLQRPALRQRGNVTSYINVETDSVCFHDDQEAEQSVRRFVTNFVKKQAANKRS